MSLKVSDSSHKSRRHRLTAPKPMKTIDEWRKVCRSLKAYLNDQNWLSVFTDWQLCKKKNGEAYM